MHAQIRTSCGATMHSMSGPSLSSTTYTKGDHQYQWRHDNEELYCGASECRCGMVHWEIHMQKQFHVTPADCNRPNVSCDDSALCIFEDGQPGRERWNELGNHKWIKKSQCKSAATIKIHLIFPFCLQSLMQLHCTSAIKCTSFTHVLTLQNTLHVFLLLCH